MWVRQNRSRDVKDLSSRRVGPLAGAGSRPGRPRRTACPDRSTRAQRPRSRPPRRPGLLGADLIRSRRWILGGSERRSGQGARISPHGITLLERGQSQGELALPLLLALADGLRPLGLRVHQVGSDLSLPPTASDVDEKQLAELMRLHHDRQAGKTKSIEGSNPRRVALGSLMNAGDVRRDAIALSDSCRSACTWTSSTELPGRVRRAVGSAGRVPRNRPNADVKRMRGAVCAVGTVGHAGFFICVRSEE